MPNAMRLLVPANFTDTSLPKRPVWDTDLGADAELMQWMVADEARLTASAGRAAAWADRRTSSPANLAQATAGKQPLIQLTSFNGLGDVKFTASRNDFFASGITHPLAGDFSWVVAFRASATTAQQHLMMVGATNAFANLYIGADERVVFRVGDGGSNNSTCASDVDVAAGQRLVAMCGYDYATKTAFLRVNGVDVPASNTGTRPDISSANPLRVGCRVQGDFGFDGELGEYQVWSANLFATAKAAKRATAAGYMLNRYGLTL